MSGTEDIWIARDGQKHGPYPLDTIQRWLAEGKLGGDSLAWRHGLVSWQPLAQLIGDVAPGVPPPLAAMPILPGDRLVRGTPPTLARDALPRPPGLHWSLVLLLSIATLGLFGWIWAFVQASWLRKVEPSSKALPLLLVGLLSTLAAVVVSVTVGPAAQGAMPLVVAGLYVLGAVLYLAACFAMGSALRLLGIKLGVPLDIGGFTLFFFHVYYLQGQLSWLRRWNDTGLTRPAAPVAPFWIMLLVLPFGISVLAAIAIPSYQDYIIRVQVLEGATMAGSAQAAVEQFYRGHGALPADNAAAGLATATAITGKYVAAVEVEDGNVVVQYSDSRATMAIRGKSLVLTPAAANGTLHWTCAGNLAPRWLPASCRG